MPTPRTLSQIDQALAAVEAQVPALPIPRLVAVETALPKINVGLQTTLRQNNLVLESEIGTLQAAVGIPADPNTGAVATGQTADIAALTALIQDLRARVAVLEAK
jgi:hypothetical protein